jgi:hypothetical protein
MKRVCAFVLLCAAAMGVEGQAHAQEAHETSAEPEYAFEGPLLRITQGSASRVVDLGCAGRSAVRSGAKLLVACGAAGVVQVDLSDPASPRREGTMRVDGDATGLFVHDGTVWVEVAHVDARPVRIGTSSAISAQTVSAPPPPSVSWTRATPPRDASPPDSRDAALAPTPSADAPADVPPADSAREAPSIAAPPRRSGLWDMSFLTSAFMAFGSLGGGVLGSASVAYRFESPIVLRVALAPFGLGSPSTTSANPTVVVPGGSNNGSSSGGGAVGVFAAHALVGLDSQFVEVGLGPGGATVNKNTPSSGSPATGSVSIVEATRIGARDGLALNVESSTIAVNQKFDLGYFVASLQIPVSRTVMFIARGGGGNVGFAYGDLGMRAVVHGDGGKGTIALTGFAGAAGIMMDLCSTNPDPPFTSTCNSANLVGPSLGGGVEWKR